MRTGNDKYYRALKGLEIKQFRSYRVVIAHIRWKIFSCLLNRQGGSTMAIEDRTDVLRLILSLSTCSPVPALEHPLRVERSDHSPGNVILAQAGLFSRASATALCNA